MDKINETFGQKILKFAKSIDILEKNNFIDIKKYIDDYAKNILKIKYIKFMIMEKTILSHKIMLRKYNLTNEKEQSLELKNGDEYNGQMPYAFDNNKKLWITSKDKSENLVNSTDYKEHWSNIEKLPKYIQIDSDRTIKTSIIIPVYNEDNASINNDNILGVVNYESSSYLTPNNKITKELLYLSKTIGKLYELYKLRNFQKNNTNSVIEDLKSDLEKCKKYPHNFLEDKKKIFFAYPDSSDTQVLGIVKDVIKNKFSNKMTLIDWNNKSNVGQITKQLLENMSKSEYAICYLSEKIDKDKEYQDNPNVLIEIGFFMSNFDKNKTGLKNIIIIREENSTTKIPFDIQDIIYITVSRFKDDNKINKEMFMNIIEEKISSMVKI